MNSMEWTTNLRKHMCKRTRLTQHAQKIARQGNGCRGRGTWSGMQWVQQTSSRRIKNRKIWQEIANRRRGTLSGEVTAVHKRERQGHACRGRRIWPDLRWGQQTSLRRMKKRKTRQEIASSRRGTLSGKVTAGETKMRQRRPNACWGFPGGGSMKTNKTGN